MSCQQGEAPQLMTCVHIHVLQLFEITSHKMFSCTKGMTAVFSESVDLFLLKLKTEVFLVKIELRGCKYHQCSAHRKTHLLIFCWPDHHSKS